MTRGRNLWLAATLVGLLTAHGAWAVCGDGALDGGESCDLGAGNGLGSTCCTTLCEFRAAGNTCRGSGGSCDIIETCSGAAAD